MRDVRLRAALLSAALLHGVAASAGSPVIRADRVVDNPDSSKTFFRPHIVAETGELGIRRGIPGACRLLGMEGYLSAYVVWSNRLESGVAIGDDGTLGEVEHAAYVESMTCTATRAHLPELEARSIDENADGSVMVRFPEIHHGPRRFPVLSGHAGACRLLGYNTPVEDSREWSRGTREGVSLALDGAIYEEGFGTTLTALGCNNAPQKPGLRPAGM